MEPIQVMTPGGRGIVWGIDRDVVLVEMDYTYIVSFPPESVKRLEQEE